MKKLLVILCLCSLLLAFAGCSDTAPATTETSTATQETTTESTTEATAETAFETTKTAVLPPVREYVRAAVKEECTFEAYTIAAKDYCAIIGLNQKDLENQGILA